ncbi:MAG: M20/M25/M40 family metallo-hydrolase [Planctomycetes bacterium]|nr:M20/M25/M40 family metallo-hydrolase [Planctomycetota bacterium]
MALTDREAELVGRLDGAQDLLEQELERLVAVSSETRDAAGANRIADLVEAELASLGFRTSELVTGVVGRTIVGRRSSDSSHRLLLLGHVDTVHPAGAGFDGYRVLDDTRATGPGAADMKGGIVVMLGALRALVASGALEDRQCTVVINADEEIGSPHSGDLVRAEATDCHLCLGFEAGRPNADGSSTFVTARKGFGRMSLAATGKAAHAGVDPGRGASALIELCHKAVDLVSLSNAETGVSVNVGVLHGGTTANTVAATAALELDYRFPDEETGADLEDALCDIAARNVLRDPDGKPLVATVMKDQIRRAAMMRTDAVGRMADRITSWGGELGLRLVEESRGGSSDAALAAEMGCPAVCGLGVVGDAFHTRDEWVLRASLVDRAKLAALVIDRFYAL